MAAGRFLVPFLLAALVPVVGAEVLPPADPKLPPAQLSLGVDLGEAHLSADLPLDVSVETTVAIPALADLPLGSRPAPAAEEDAAAATASTSGGAWHAPQAVLVPALITGSSLLATTLALSAWLAKPALGLFSRIETDALAQHPLRRQALDLIAANPGATVQSVRKGLGIAWGTAVYHLGRLERAGLVAVRHSEGRRGHYPLGQAPARDALAPTGEALARLVRERPGLPQNELARLAGIGPPAACKQLRRLESAGFVQATRSGRARVYVPTSSLDGVLAKAGPAPAAGIAC